MNAASPTLADRLAGIQDRIAQATRRSGRDPGAVTLIGVVKGVAPEKIRGALDLGLRDLGGNRVQDTVALQDALERTACWHMIGNLQRNKAGRAAERFDRIQTVDDAELARALSRHAVRLQRTLPVLIQVNVSGEPQKHGVEPQSLEPLVLALADLPGLTLDGLMSIGAEVARPEDARRYFAATRELRDRAARGAGVPLPQLSMGMSGDFEVAIEEGSTMVRIGTALFGARN